MGIICLSLHPEHKYSHFLGLFWEVPLSPLPNLFTHLNLCPPGPWIGVESLSRQETTRVQLKAMPTGKISFCQCPFKTTSKCSYNTLAVHSQLITICELSSNIILLSHFVMGVFHKVTKGQGSNKTTGVNILGVARSAFSRLLFYIPCPLGEGNATGHFMAKWDRYWVQWDA